MSFEFDSPIEFVFLLQRLCHRGRLDNRCRILRNCGRTKHNLWGPGSGRVVVPASIMRILLHKLAFGVGVTLVFVNARRIVGLTNWNERWF